MKKDKLLIVVDMQNDFVDGALGSKEAQEIVPNVVKRIQEWDGDIIATFDTHQQNYLDTNEGKHLPVVHCVFGTKGYKLNKEVQAALDNKERYTPLAKPTFGSTKLPEIIQNTGVEYIEIVGLCTDICVVSNALILKANFPEITIAVDPSCCAGVTPETHKAALTTMEMCQIEMVGESI